jgi:ABC-2 type transport system permease protein
MRSVLEEKNNRVVEIIISSVKPFELMMGKILGVTMVALTQFIVWITMSVIGALVLNTGFSAIPKNIPGMKVLLKNWIFYRWELRFHTVYWN